MLFESFSYFDILFFKHGILNRITWISDYAFNIPISICFKYCFSFVIKSNSLYHFVKRLKKSICYIIYINLLSYDLKGWLVSWYQFKLMHWSSSRSIFSLTDTPGRHMCTPTARSKSQKVTHPVSKVIIQDKNVNRSMFVFMVISFSKNF